MSGRILSFSQYLGGGDNVKIEERFPNDQKTFTYNYANADVSGYTFTADYQNILLSSVTYDRTTGDPNFTDTTVTGYFGAAANISASGNVINTSQAATGIVKFTIPADLYTGNVIPDARANVVATVVSFQWQTNDSPVQKDRHRWVLLNRYDPMIGKVPRDPALESNFVKIT
jgi:hypothetical protein